MKKMKRKLLIWGWAGVGVVFLAGSLLHFVFEWSGSWSPVALVAAVNVLYQSPAEEWNHAGYFKPLIHPD